MEARQAPEDPIRDALGWIQYLEDLGAPTPDFVLTSEKRYSYFANNAACRAAIWNSVSPSTAPTATLAPAQFRSLQLGCGIICLGRVQTPL
ncbi:hypothetical protein ACFU8Q_22725 [Streptomyces sp. NPDC057543]|uniref:hypothetical protein n=1 Tax=Streptomyces sp. NPDC057543 TaxID=3346163 RepID=UPI0036C39708